MEHSRPRLCCFSVTKRFSCLNGSLAALGMKTKKERPKFASVSEQMKEWSALLGTELCHWPAVTSRRMFGMTVFYRKGKVFAALPRTNTFTTPNSIAFKLYRKTPKVNKMLNADPRITDRHQEDGSWISFELDSEKHLNDALHLLEQAYNNAKDVRR